MIATLTLHVMAALLLGLTLLFAMSIGMAMAEDARKKCIGTVAVILTTPAITLAVLVIA